MTTLERENSKKKKIVWKKLSLPSSSDCNMWKKALKICKKTVFLSAVFILTLSAKTENPIFAQENSAQKNLEMLKQRQKE